MVGYGTVGYGVVRCRSVWYGMVVAIFFEDVSSPPSAGHRLVTVFGWSLING